MVMDKFIDETETVVYNLYLLFFNIDLTALNLADQEFHLW